MPETKTKLGVIGCGNISATYFRVAKRFENIEIVACADLNMDAARAKAGEFEVPRACTVSELLADPGIEIVVNLTVPAVHAEVGMKALQAGKHVLSEKPLAVERESGRALLECAKAKGLRVGCAPDTFLGAGLQTARKLLDEGVIGEPVAATAFMLGHGHEGWHPNPEFFYKPGGGPMFDMGPYYLTALVHLLGPVRRVTACTRITFPERTITSQPRAGQKIKVDVPTHIAGVMEFHNGAIGTIITSFDVWGHHLPCIEVHGTKGSLGVPDPNGFGGPVRLKLPPYKDWVEVRHTHRYGENFRGIGVADLARALRSGRAHRASGALAFHVLDLMQSFHEASAEGRHIELASTCERPAPLPPDLPEGRLDP